MQSQYIPMFRLHSYSFSPTNRQQKLEEAPAPVQVPTPAGRQPARTAPQKHTAEEDELAALQAEMAL